jgi:hypothetical protein
VIDPPEKPEDARSATSTNTTGLAVGVTVGVVAVIVAAIVLFVLWRRRGVHREPSELGYDIEMPSGNINPVTSDSEWDNTVDHLGSVGENLWAAPPQADATPGGFHTFQTEEAYF